MPQFIITATGTDVGKTLVSAILVRALQGVYWKPIQSGALPQTDRQTVKNLTQLPDRHFLPEVYCLSQPLSPHRAAELDDIEIDVGKIISAYNEYRHPGGGRDPGVQSAVQGDSWIPAAAGMTDVKNRALIIEGAGGPLVPITRHVLQIELFKQLGAPLIVVAHTSLGTINHTLSAIEVIRARNIQLQGLIFSGPDNPDNIRTIADFSDAKILGHLPQLDMITPQILEQAFAENFNRADFISD